MNGLFEENDIPEDYFSLVKVEKFDPLDKHKQGNFDPVVHLEIVEEENEEGKEEGTNDILMEDDDEANLLDRRKIDDIYKYWLTISPQKSDFAG